MLFRGNLAERFGEFLTRNSGWFIATVVAVTALLVVPLVLLAPSEQASQDPGGPVFDLQELVDQRFPPRIHVVPFIVEDREGDILRQKPLWELYQNQQALRDSDLGHLLYRGYDADTERQISGLFTIADAVHNFLRLNPFCPPVQRGAEENCPTLETATDDQTKLAIHHILTTPMGKVLRESLSKDASSERRVVNGQEIDYWRSPALSAFVAADNKMLGGGSAMVNISGDAVALRKEQFNRQIQELLRGEQTNFRLWGIAIDVNLESREEGRTAAPFIVATGLLAVVVVGVTLRSLRAVGLACLGLAMLMVWLKGGSNLVGLKSSLTLDFIVPIAMISLGVDYFIHASSRYQEERRRVGEPRRGLRMGFAGVLGALTLAMLTDGIAFFSNLTSGIETVIGFGIAAGIAVFSAYIILGIFLPLINMRLEERRLRAKSGPPSPLWERTEVKSTSSPSQPTPILKREGEAPQATYPSLRSSFTGPIVRVARLPWLVMSITLIITVVTTYLAFQLEPKLDVKEFFDSRSDFVISLDKLDQHTASALSGEPGVIHIEGDLTAPESLLAISGLIDRLGDNEHVGHGSDGSVYLYARTVFTLLSRIIASEYARQQVQSFTGVAITDTNTDGIPDTPIQIDAAYQYMVEHGVPLNEQTMAYDSAQVRETLFYQPLCSPPLVRRDIGGSLPSARGDARGCQATRIVFGVLGTREQTRVGLARRSLEHDMAPLREVPTISSVGLTGSPFTRDITLNATTRSLNTSLPVTTAACFLLLAFWMHSIRFAMVTVIPIGLVVSWLYAFLYLAGFHLNFVTATIGAVSVGVGIDYSIHVTQRFREELRRHTDSINALWATAQGTGMALLGSAASSILGFAVMGFAPMPLFSAYGILTAVMIIMASGAALLVLPCLLVLVTPKVRETREASL